MTNSGLLGPLVDAIEDSRQQMLTRRRDLTANETRTRTALINPILRALDWNVSDSSQVTTEYDLPSGRVDYALLGSNGKVIAVIEAKKLGEDLTKHRGQLVRYAYESRPAYAVLTDGDLWELYSVETSESEFRFQQLTQPALSENDPLQSARTLLVLWQANLQVTQTERRQEPPPNGNWVSLLGFVPESKARPPSSIRFPDNAVHEIVNWRNIQIAVVEWLYATGNLKASTAPFQYSPTGRIHVSPSRVDGKPFASPYQIGGQDLYIETHGDRRTLIRRTKDILSHFQVNVADVHLRFPNN